MLLEAGVATIMETVHEIYVAPEGSDDSEALDMTQLKFGGWMAKAATNVDNKVSMAIDNASQTREKNEHAAKTRIMNATTDKQKISD